MKKTLLQTKKDKELKKLKKIVSDRKKIKIKLAAAELELMTLTHCKNKERREIYHKYKKQVKQVSSEVEYLKNILLNS